VPKSKVRKKSESPLRAQTLAPTTRALAPSPTWYPIVMVAVMLVGLAYLVVYYLAGDRIPLMNDISGWNFAVGFGFLIVGLLMAVRWR
jgi:Cell division protein CrgA